MTAITSQVDLGRLRNNVGISAGVDTSVGRFNVWRNSLPAEELPVGTDCAVDGIPFAFPAAGAGQPDNVRCEGQLIAPSPGRYDWLYLLVAAERRVEDEIAMHFAEGTVDFEPLRVSDFWAAEPAFGETRAFVSEAMHYPHHVQRGVPGLIWCQRVAVTRRAELAAIRLPDNMAVHVFAATLVTL